MREGEICRGTRTDYNTRRKMLHIRNARSDLSSLFL